MTIFRPCREIATNNIHLRDIETVDLEKYEPLIEGVAGNRKTLGLDGVPVEVKASTADNSAELIAAQEAAIVEEALAKNPSKRKA